MYVSARARAHMCVCVRVCVRARSLARSRARIYTSYKLVVIAGISSDCLRARVCAKCTS